MEPQNKLKMEITKNGKILKYVSTDASHSGLQGHFTDLYRDEDGNLHYIDRVRNEITFTTYPRNNAEGKMTSFAFNFQRLLNGLKDDCTDAELDRYILQCESHIKTALKIFAKEYQEDYYEQACYDAIAAKIEEKIKELTLGESTFAIDDMLNRAVNAPRMLENAPFHNALKLAIYKVNNPEIEPKIEP